MMHIDGFLFQWYATRIHTYYEHSEYRYYCGNTHLSFTGTRFI